MYFDGIYLKLNVFQCVPIYNNGIAINSMASWWCCNVVQCISMYINGTFKYFNLLQYLLIYFKVFLCILMVSSYISMYIHGTTKKYQGCYDSIVLYFNVK
jgi:hypothetical protein